MDDAAIEKMMQADGWADVQRFVLGKVTGGWKRDRDGVREHYSGCDSFFARRNLRQSPSQPELWLSWPVRGAITRNSGACTGWSLSHPEPPEIALQEGTSLSYHRGQNRQRLRARLRISADVPADGWKKRHRQIYARGETMGVGTR